jgi:hypothetical protein
MAKDRKKKSRPALTKEQIYRRNLVNNYNKAYTDRKMLYREPKQEEIDALRDRMLKIKENRNAMTYLIADAANAHRVVDFLLDYNTNRVFWGKDMWKGIVEFDKVLKTWKELNENNTDVEFRLDFAAMFYCYTVLNNPAGAGLESALYMESIEEEFNAIVDVLNGYVDDFNKEQEKFKLLNDVYETMLQGYMIVLNDDEESNNVVDEVPEGLEEATLDDTIDSEVSADVEVVENDTTTA